MLLSILLKDVEVCGSYNDINVSDVLASTAENLENAAFVCIKGTHFDGHEFAKKALQNGAAVIICEYDLHLDSQVIVKDTKKCFSIMCKHFYGDNAEKLALIAATGTNGKTSTTCLINRILLDAGMNAGLISTIEARYADKSFELCNTTPDAHTLHKLFDDMKNAGCEAVCMEASSHALDQERLFGCHFQIAIFTNLTQDHLDYHKSMENYFEAKKKLFCMADYAIINIDDSYGKLLYDAITIPKCSYSIKDETADFFACDIANDCDGVSFLLRYNQVFSRVKFAIPGLYSVSNALASIAACVKLKVSLKSIINSIAKVEGIMGRCEVLKTCGDFNIICDFAHTPDGLVNILKSTREYAKGRIVCLFGCGGDRDKTKRQLMGKAACEYADFAIITSDNPRTENPQSIIADILKGIPENYPHIAIVDRTEAIFYALKNAQKDDTIILAGKGHEHTQVLGDKKFYYDERCIVKKCIAAMERKDN